MISLIKKTLLGSLIAISAVVLFIFVFGSLDPLHYGIAPKVPTLHTEALPPAPATLSQTNITEEIAKQIAQEIVTKNPSGPNAGSQTGITSIDPTTLTQEALTRAFTEIKVEDLKPAIALTELTIIKSNDTAFTAHYFNAINAILNKNFPEGVSVNWDSPEQTDFNALINAFGLSMTESLAVAVPEHLAELHRKYIALLGAEKNTLSLIKNYVNDPAQAAVAIEAGNTFTTELTDVFAQMNAYIAAHKIALTA